MFICENCGNKDPKYIGLDRFNKQYCRLCVAFKKEKVSKREIDFDEAKQFAETFHGKYFEISSLTGEGVEMLFQDFTLKMVVLVEQNKLNYINNTSIRISNDCSRDESTIRYSKYGNYDKDGSVDTSSCC